MIFSAHAGIPTYTDAAHAIAHNKVMIIEGSGGEEVKRACKGLYRKLGEAWGAFAKLRGAVFIELNNTAIK